MKVCIFDCETTGKLHPDHRIIEASFRVCDLNTGEEIKHVLYRFNPERNIDARAFKVHGIALEDLKTEPTFKDKAEEIATLLSECDYLSYHNGDSFDRPYLKQELERVGVKHNLDSIKTFDTMKEGNFATDLGKSPTLYELCFALDIVFDPDSAHSAAYDTEVLKLALFNGLRLGWFFIDGVKYAGNAGS